MNHNQDTDREVIEEQEVIDSLIDENSQSLHQSHEQQHHQSHGPQSHRVVYTGMSGCFDIKSAVINILIYTIVLMVTSGLFRGFYIESFTTAIVAACVMSVLNIILKPILVFITLPLTIMTFGMFYVVINGIILWVASLIMGPSFEIWSFSTAVIASVFISLLRMGINHFILKDKRLKVN